MGNTKESAGKVTVAFFWQLASRGTVMLLRLLLLFFLSRLLTAEDFGVANFAYTVATLLVNISIVGLGAGLIQRKELTPTDIQTAFISYLGIGVLLSGLLWMVSESLCNFLNIPEAFELVQWFSVIPFASSLGATSYHILMRELRFKSIAIIDFVAFVICNFVGGIWLATAGFGYWAIGLPSLAYILLINVLYVFMAPITLTRGFNVKAFKSLFNFGIFNSTASILNTLAKQVDVFIISKFMGSHSLGIYNRSLSLMTVNISLLGEIIDRILFPAFARHQGNSMLLNKAFMQLSYLIALLLMPFSVFLILNATQIVYFVLGLGWGESVLPFQILCLVLVIRLNYKIGHQMLKAIGQIKNATLNQALFLLATLISAFLLIPFGISGIALAVVAGMLTLYISTNYFLFRSKQLNLSLVKIVRMNWPIYLGSLLYCIAHIFMSKYLISNPVLVLIISLMFLMVFYVYLILLERTRLIVIELNLPFLQRFFIKLTSIK